MAAMRTSGATEEVRRKQRSDASVERRRKVRNTSPEPEGGVDSGSVNDTEETGEETDTSAGALATIGATFYLD